MSDSDEIYQGRFQRVQSMYPDVDRDALAAAFLEGAGAFAQANGRDISGSDDLYLAVRRRTSMRWRGSVSSTQSGEESE